MIEPLIRFIIDVMTEAVSFRSLGEAVVYYDHHRPERLNSALFAGVVRWYVRFPLAVLELYYGVLFIFFSFLSHVWLCFVAWAFVLLVGAFLLNGGVSADYVKQHFQPYAQLLVTPMKPEQPLPPP